MGRITNFEIQKFLKVSRQDAYKNLKNLIDLDLVERKDGGRFTDYILPGH